MSETAVGTLVFDSGQVRFEGEGRVEVLENLKIISYGRKGTDFANRWIEIHYGPPNRRSVAFVKDGRWRGWRSIITSSNREITDALKDFNS
jgi:hypothetical protein